MSDDQTPQQPPETAAETDEQPAAETDVQSQAAEKEPQLPTPEVAVERLGPCRCKVTMTASPQTVEAHREAKYKEIADKAQVPGFRPGRAPRRLLVKRFGEDVDKDILRELVVAGFEKVVDEHELNVVGQPEMDLENRTLPAEGPFQFDFEVEVKPDFELPAYKGIPLAQRNTEVTDEQVAEQREQLRKRLAYARGDFEPTDEPVQAEDLITAEVVGVLAETGEEFYRDQERAMLVGPGMLIVHPTRDEVETMAGAKVGQTRTAPGHVGPRHENVELRGKDAHFQITVKQVKRLRLPEVDDEFARQVGADSAENLDDLLREEAEGRKAAEAAEADREAVRDWLTAHTSFELPAEMTERQKQRSFQRRILRLLQQGVPEQVIAERETELKQQVDAAVERDLKLQFIIARIAEQEGIEADPEEINGIISQLAVRLDRRFARLREEMEQDGRLDTLAAEVTEHQVLDALIEQADRTGAAPAEAAQAAPDAGEAQDSQ